MTTPQELLANVTTDPRYDVVRVAYTELLVTDLAAAEAFYVGLLGMVVAQREPDCLYLRGWEERVHHSLILRSSPVAALGRIGFLLRHEDDLDLLAHDIRSRGLAISWRKSPDPGLGCVLAFRDPFGYPLEFFHEIAQVPSQHQRFDLHRGAPLLRFDHVNLHVPRLEEAIGFWGSLGFRCSEYISTDTSPERITGAWLYRKPSVHDVALTAGRGPRLHHFAFWVGDPAGVLRACDQIAAADHAVAIERGPGRHGVSNAFFVYLRDPDGHRIELYSCDYWTGDPAHSPMRWSVNDNRCRSFWGTRAPDSWYEESTDILGPDRQLLPTESATVDERDQRSEVLA